ncbi:hypothetical protein AKJ58_00185 [candidate division MSBL1 archaeon SCGC-AAA385D11]|uniref:HTH deoR-type domain-containing protein n=1 Tax=candidate division MSBL1 archaeon SCGC-AAA385D11 TaxID=1698286 RepID=A0A133VPJ5_9EURY|nr:hypothetical protein AKJ58_00185 [candidate division MSBL1 archaeon SCGC-AAA385D11]
MGTFTKEVKYNKENWKIDEKEIMEFARHQEVVKGQDVAKEFDISYETARKYLDVLTHEGKLKRNELESWEGNKKYYIYRVEG